MKDKIIILLIVLMCLEAIVGYTGFIWYESQFDVTETVTTEYNTDLDTSGDNASINYTDTDYNDNSTHIENGGN